MDHREDRVKAADDPNDDIDLPSELSSPEDLPERPAVEPYDPYFGRRKAETILWP